MSKIKLLSQYVPWSPSKANLAAQCALAFKFRYIDKIPAGPKGMDGVIGVIVHRAQELVLLGAHSGNQALAKALAENTDPLTDEALHRILLFEEAIDAFKKRIDAFCEKYPVQEILLEQKWGITDNFEPCAFEDPHVMMRGILDLALFLKSGHVVIIDHKTGKVRPAAYYKAQLDIYSIFALSHLPGLVGVQAALHYVARQRIEWSDPVRRSHIEKLLRQWLISYLTRRAERVETGIATPGWHCKYCDFRETCPSAFKGDLNGEVGISARKTKD